ncbi:MAG: hypothetical protein K6T73_03350 [Candidatus Bathyarchaeota archaeon]|nr:hypothetical protein [Candidatus Bathyarchaeota archaeon]
MSEEELEVDPLMYVMNLLHTIGGILVVDDYKDYGKVDRLHHWLLGEIMRQLSTIAGTVYIGWRILNAEGDSNILDEIIRQYGES